MRKIAKRDSMKKKCYDAAIVGLKANLDILKLHSITTQQIEELIDVHTSIVDIFYMKFTGKSPQIPQEMKFRMKKLAEDFKRKRFYYLDYI